ncbi:hypothetical protein GCM10023084_69990 [Streptomyces lacrimifluminis]|uniref:Uncharacterized protein n=1 Tax=Streptomyces lacrimifluminis TaxID=1500077 RepID=A0A917P4W3_9ACTN|nr:hypothetical protein GCM10012282_68750 [Streptomyces lacrimifluminis]
MAVAAAELEPGEVTMSAVAADTMASAVAILFLVPDFMAFIVVPSRLTEGALRSRCLSRPVNAKWSLSRTGPPGRRARFSLSPGHSTLTSESSHKNAPIRELCAL